MKASQQKHRAFRKKKKGKIDTSKNTGNWNHLNIMQTVPEQHTGKARYQGTTENSHIGHCTHTAGSADVNAQNIFQVRNHITCSIKCKYRASATLCTP